MAESVTPLLRPLTHVTLEEYIEANGGIADFLEALNDFARSHGFDWLEHLKSMQIDADYKARFFSRMGYGR